MQWTIEVEFLLPIEFLEVMFPLSERFRVRVQRQESAVVSVPDLCHLVVEDTDECRREGQLSWVITSLTTTINVHL